MSNRTADDQKLQSRDIGDNTEVTDSEYNGTILKNELLMIGDDGKYDQAAPGQSNARFGGVSFNKAIASSTPKQKLKIQRRGFYLARVESSDANAVTNEAFRLLDGGSNPTLARTHNGRWLYAKDSMSLDIDPDDPSSPLAGYIWKILATGGAGSGIALVYLDQDWAAGNPTAVTNPLAAFTRPINPVKFDGVDVGSRHVFQDSFVNKPILNGDSPGSVAAITATTVDLTNMDDGSANNVLIALTGTYDATEAGKIEQNFDKIGDEINALVTDLTALRTATINGFFANKAWEVAGTNMTTALCTYAADGGVTLTTAGADNDQAILRGHKDSNQSAVEQMSWNTGQKMRFRAVVELPATITTYQLVAGWKLDETDLSLGGDADQAVFRADTNGAVSTANFTTCDSNNGTDNEQDTAIAFAASTEYELVIDIDEDRIPRYYINGDLVATGSALRSLTTLKPCVSLQALSAAARSVTVRSVTVAMGHNA